MKTIPKMMWMMLACGTPALAGTAIVDAPPGDAGMSTSQGDWLKDLRRPMTNPTLFDLAAPATGIRPIFVHHELPDFMETTLGRVPVGGDVQVYALQFEYALSDRLSIVATKDGYIDFNPDATFTDSSGFANLGGGVKYAFLLDPEQRHALSGSMTFEFPTGNSDVLQGEGDGAVNLILSGVKMIDDWQFAGGAGVSLPFSGEMSTTGFLSTHVSYEVTPWFIPLVELNWFTVLDPGNGSRNFAGQVGGLVPGVATFEGHDFFNLGASNSSRNRDLVTAAVGFRSRITDDIHAGLAYEIPLTDEEASVIDSRVTLDMTWRF